ncbi:MAG: transcription elongation factor Spt5 [Candidatus Methanofastidiosia archaeon]
MIFTLKVTLNQERNISEMLFQKILKKRIKLGAILVPDTIRGYLFVEAEDKGAVEEAIAGMRHVKSILPGVVQFSEVEHFLEAKPTVSGIDKGDIIEVIAGPFKGERAKVVRTDEDKEELTIELVEGIVPIPITVGGDYVRLVEKRGGSR